LLGWGYEKTATLTKGGRGGEGQKTVVTRATERISFKGTYETGQQ